MHLKGRFHNHNKEFSNNISKIMGENEAVSLSWIFLSSWYLIHTSHLAIQ